MRILIAGDFCPRGRLLLLIEKKEYESVFTDVREITHHVDWAIVNLECPVSNKQPIPIRKYGGHLFCTHRSVEALRWAGFNCVTLANNHFLDYGEEGVANTLEACQKYGIDVVGGGRNLQEAARILYKEINGQTLAVINCCEHEFSIATELTAGSNPLNPIQQYYAIQEAKQNADYVLVIVHGGHEYYQLPSPRMQETYRFFVDAGADAVVNHHQHCYSGYEVYNGKPIFYGLGNFCFDKASSHSGMWTEGYAVTINFTLDNLNFIIHPYRQCAQKPDVEMLETGTFDAKLMELNSVIVDSSLLERETRKYYKITSGIQSNIFEPINNRVYLSAKARGWLPSLISNTRKLKAQDFVCCESHRDKLIYWLKNT